MSKHLLFSFIFITFLCSYTRAFTQNADFIVVHDIKISGNKRTKERVVYQELNIAIGDTIYKENQNDLLEKNRQRILNTGMFNDVQIEVLPKENSASEVHISLIENWYIYPSPIIELADRNFNVWWEDQKRSLKRINYGIRAEHINFTGNRDKLSFTAQFGYTRKYELKYNFPFLNKSHKLGGGAFIYFAENKEIGYITEGNKTIFKNINDQVVLERFRIGANLKWRPSVFTTHTYRLEFHRNSIHDSIAQVLNTNYFLDKNNQLQFFMVNYDIIYDRRNFKLYPKEGYSVNANVKKSGLGVFKGYNNLELYVDLEKYHTLRNTIIFGTKLKLKGNLIRDKVAFANNTGLGYGQNFVRGYELYVIDGTDYIFSKNAVKFQILNKDISLDENMPLRQFKKLNVQVYFALNGDFGYVNERHYYKDNELNNRVLYGGGPGLDILLFNNYLFRLEYNFNHKGEKGLFLQNAVSF